MSKIIINVGSVTMAIKLKKLLLRKGIYADQTKGVKEGLCTYGVIIDGSDLYNAIGIMQEVGMKYSIEQ